MRFRAALEADLRARADQAYRQAHQGRPLVEVIAEEETCVRLRGEAAIRLEMGRRLLERWPWLALSRTA